ncbi:MAG: hypothetical protein KJ968_05745 [Nanoarchaeota archaeon]|nr:hypothetical protein [Nanoarchaeota archaeon]
MELSDYLKGIKSASEKDLTDRFGVEDNFALYIKGDIDSIVHLLENINSPYDLIEYSTDFYHFENKTDKVVLQLGNHVSVPNMPSDCEYAKDCKAKYALHITLHKDSSNGSSIMALKENILYLTDMLIKNNIPFRIHGTFMQYHGDISKVVSYEPSQEIVNPQ